MTPFLITPLLAAALLTPPQPDPHAVWPLDPRPEIVRGFEPPPKPWLPGHRGLDLRGSPGQQVRSATHGKVTYAAPLAGRGVIVITNGPLRTTYEPVNPTVRAGALVTPGTPLGTLSAAASHCAPATCLHWGLLQATSYLNPLALLPQRPIRLLPLTRPPNSINAAPTQSIPAPPPPRNPTRPHTATAATDRAADSPAPTASPLGTSAPHPQEAGPPTQGNVTSGVLVGLAAIATLTGSLLIRRH
ncbi:M23 family metallopeptidase [Kribbella sp. NPDC056861]|uniref:M23 family metallopeptidase n=1 Tax=Kribbella sp. NPDC056861 TaxID=3154857 RepID=UPI003449F89C